MHGYVGNKEKQEVKLERGRVALDTLFLVWQLFLWLALPDRNGSHWPFSPHTHRCQKASPLTASCSARAQSTPCSANPTPTKSNLGRLGRVRSCMTSRVPDRLEAPAHSLGTTTLNSAAQEVGQNRQVGPGKAGKERVSGDCRSGPMWQLLQSTRGFRSRKGLLDGSCAD